MDKLGQMTPDGLGGVTLAVWTAAILSLCLLCLLSLVTEIFVSRSREPGSRLLRAVMALLFPAIALVPGALLADWAGIAPGLGLVFYVVFFAFFCYYLGRRVGRRQGRRNISDLVGLESSGDIEDAQDRLFESRMRYPNRADVIVSIGEMSRAREAERLQKEREDVGRPPPPDAGADGVAMEVESIVHKESKQNLRP